MFHWNDVWQHYDKQTFIPFIITTRVGGPVGGCQWTGDKAYNMGYIQSDPVAVSDGSLSIRYFGGTLCHKGQPTESQRSTRINFFCSDVEVSALVRL